jgi:hypothetical protein
MKTFFTIVAAVCALAGCGGNAPEGVGASANGNGNTVTELPLKRGFYVASDSDCGQASNATLLLVHSGGINGSRDACDFTSIEQTGPTGYRAVVACRNIQGGETESSTNVYEIPDATQFSYGADDSDYRSHFRYCEQSSLPDPWRDNDISDLVGEPTRP